MLARARQQKPQVGRGSTGLGWGEAAAANDSEVIPLLQLGPGQDYKGLARPRRNTRGARQAVSE